MTNTEDVTSQLYSFLSKISHPIEGTFYLFLIAVVIRWKWPLSWNNFLQSISADIEARFPRANESLSSTNSFSVNTPEEKEI